MLRHVPEGTKAARAAPWSRALVDDTTDDGTPFGWFVLDEGDEAESVDVALSPYLDLLPKQKGPRKRNLNPAPPNQMWRYRTTEDAHFFDLSRADAVEEVDRRLSEIDDAPLREKYREALRTAFPLVGATVRRYSDPDVDATLMRGMVRAGLLRGGGVRGWAHPTMRRPEPDGGVHRREVVALDPSAYLRSERALSTSPTGGTPGSARRSARSAASSAGRSTRSSTRRRSAAASASGASRSARSSTRRSTASSASGARRTGARRRRVASPASGGKRTPPTRVVRAMAFQTP